MSLVTYYGFNERADLTKARQFNTEQEIKDFLKLKFGGGMIFGVDTLLRSGNYREAAINYDFRPWLTKYLVEHDGSNLSSAWAPNKTSLRRAAYYPRTTRILVYPKA